jgi:hypothetical protein
MAQQAPPLTNVAVKRLLAARTNTKQPQAHNSFQGAPSRKPVALQTAPTTEVVTDDMLPPLLDGDNSNDDSDDDDDKGTPLHHSPVRRFPMKQKRPQLTKSMNPRFFEKSLMGKAWKAQKKQPFGKDNLLQTFTTEPVLLHIILPVLKQGFLSTADMRSLLAASSPIDHLWTEYQRVKDLDWSPLCEPNTHWSTRESIDADRVDLRMALLFYYDMDLVAVHRHLGGNHVGAHRNHDNLLAHVEHLLPRKLFRELR